MANLMSDIQVFVLPDKDRIEVHADGRVIHTAQDSTEAYATETDISKTRLGALLRGVLLEAVSKSLPSQERPLNLSTQDLSTQVKSEYESELSATSKSLRQEVRQTLLSSGIPAEEVEFFGTVSLYVKILNETRNPVKTAQTFRSKESYPERFNSWRQRRQRELAKNPVPQPPSPKVAPGSNSKVFQLCDGCGEDVDACTCLPSASAFEIED
jgi:hypothetical protein